MPQAGHGSVTVHGAVRLQWGGKGVPPGVWRGSGHVSSLRKHAAKHLLQDGGEVFPRPERDAGTEARVEFEALDK